jgi:hypothetical protein
MIESTDTIGLDLEEARAKIEAVREKLQRALEGQGGDQEAVRLLGRLERLSADVARVEGVVAGQGVEAALEQLAPHGATRPGLQEA